MPYRVEWLDKDLRRAKVTEYTKPRWWKKSVPERVTEVKYDYGWEYVATGRQLKSANEELDLFMLNERAAELKRRAEAEEWKCKEREWEVTLPEARVVRADR